MNRVFAALKTLGIPDNKIQTSNFSVQPQYPPYRPDAPEPRNTIVGYQVSNQVTVIVDDLSKLGAALDALIRSGGSWLQRYRQRRAVHRAKWPLLWAETRALGSGHFVWRHGILGYAHGNL